MKDMGLKLFKKKRGTGAVYRRVSRNYIFLFIYLYENVTTTHH